MIEKFRCEYEDEFGALDTVREYTRDELIDKYARDIRFWQDRQPTIETKRTPSTRIVCIHAITTNAIRNMWKLCHEKHIEPEVRALVEKHAPIVEGLD